MNLSLASIAGVLHCRLMADVAFFTNCFLAYQAEKGKKKNINRTLVKLRALLHSETLEKQQQATIPPTFDGRKFESSRDDHKILDIWSFGL